MPEYNPDSGPEPKYKHGWWIFPAVILVLFLCVLLIALLLPRLHTSSGAAAFLAITFAGTILLSLLSVWIAGKK